MITIQAGGWDNLLRRMGATPSDWRYTGPTGAPLPEWQVTLGQVGIEVGLDEISVDRSTGLYLFKGQQVLIYIKFARRPREVLEHDREASPRFHFRDCKTIQDMKARNRFQRYVAIARTDGFFPVVSQEMEGGKFELEARLGPCKNCLNAMGYKGYHQQSVKQRQEIWETFSIEEFFAAYSSSISSIPIDCCSAIDPREYAEGWEAKSEQVRARSGWKCTSCRVYLGGHRRLLHVHHNDRDKQNNLLYNLTPLCMLCHRAQPGHQSMHVSSDSAERILRLRREQGIETE